MVAEPGDGEIREYRQQTSVIMATEISWFVRDLRTRFPEVKICVYQDDMVITGPSSQVQECLKVVLEIQITENLISAKKCEWLQ